MTDLHHLNSSSISTLVANATLVQREIRIENHKKNYKIPWKI